MSRRRSTKSLAAPRSRTFMSPRPSPETLMVRASSISFKPRVQTARRASLGSSACGGDWRQEGRLLAPRPGHARRNGSERAVVRDSWLGAPGATETEQFRAGKTEQHIPRLAEMAALERLGHVDDIADVVACLASDEARWMTGQNIGVNGGTV